MHPDDTTHHPFDAERLLGVLGEEGVAYVLIGGYAAQLHGAGRPTVDIDVTPARDQENLDAAHSRAAAVERPHPHTRRTRRAAVRNLRRCAAGPQDAEPGH